MLDRARLEAALAGVPHADALIDWLEECQAHRNTRWFAARFELDILLFASSASGCRQHVTDLARLLSTGRLGANPTRQFEAFCRTIRSPANQDPLAPPADGYAHVCSFKDFATNHGGHTDIYFDDALVASPQAEELWNQIAEQEVSGAGFSASIGEKSSRKVFWLTRSDLVPPGSRRANDEECVMACEQLGLWDFAGGEPCVLIRIPGPAAPQPRRPTMFDALGREAFCPGRDSHDWGLALRSEDLEDGAPEAIHGVIPWDDSYRVRGLGRANRDTFTVREVPEALADSALSRRRP